MNIFKKLKIRKLKRVEKRIKEQMEKFENIEVIPGKANKDTLRKSAVIEIGGYDQEALKNVMEEYCANYGKLPDPVYEMPIDKSAKYLRDRILKHQKKGIKTLSEIEYLIKERESFKGVNSKGIIDKESYKIYVSNTLIYDSKNDFFDCQYKRLKIYSEIQHIIAKAIYGKELATLRKERNKQK